MLLEGKAHEKSDVQNFSLGVPEWHSLLGLGLLVSAEVVTSGS